MKCSCASMKCSCTSMKHSCVSIKCSCTSMKHSCTSIKCSCTSIKHSCTSIKHSCTSMFHTCLGSKHSYYRYFKNKKPPHIMREGFYFPFFLLHLEKVFFKEEWMRFTSYHPYRPFLDYPLALQDLLLFVLLKHILLLIALQQLKQHFPMQYGKL
jgi:hypothetical protein